MERSPWYKDVLTTLEDGTVKKVHDPSLVFSDDSDVVEESGGFLSNVLCGAGQEWPDNSHPYFNGDYTVKLCCKENVCEEM